MNACLVRQEERNCPNSLDNELKTNVIIIMMTCSTDSLWEIKLSCRLIYIKIYVLEEEFPLELMS